jgi:hypothetical protein
VIIVLVAHAVTVITVDSFGELLLSYCWYLLYKSLHVKHGQIVHCCASTVLSQCLAVRCSSHECINAWWQSYMYVAGTTGLPSLTSWHQYPSVQLESIKAASKTTEHAMMVQLRGGRCVVIDMFNKLKMLDDATTAAHILLNVTAVVHCAHQCTTHTMLRNAARLSVARYSIDFKRRVSNYRRFSYASATMVQCCT